MNLLIKNIDKAFRLTLDLVENFSEDCLTLKLKDLPSNKIGEQLWCVLGARESYFRAIQNNKWSGFSCSIKNKYSKEEIIMGLNKTSQETLKYLKENKLTEIQANLLLDLLEHEIQHHGQLIRYVYGNGLKFPRSWGERYTV